MISSIKSFSYDLIPLNFLLCDGSLLNIEDYPELFSIIGNKYGGNGVDNFQLPLIESKNIRGSNILSSPYQEEELNSSLFNLTLSHNPHTHTSTYNNRTDDNEDDNDGTPNAYMVTAGLTTRTSSVGGDHSHSLFGEGVFRADSIAFYFAIQYI